MPETSSPFPSSRAKRSPFPRRSLPQAGESLQEVRDDIIFGKVVGLAAVAITSAGIAGYQFLMQWLGIRITPWHLLSGAFFIAVLALWQYFRHKPRLDALHQGIRGERMIARMLEEMRVLGYVPFHDIPGERFNVDHALIGPGGVFAIETKTISKRPGPDVQVEYDGERVLVDGHAPDRDPIAQAAAGADYLRDLLQRMTDRQVTVRPVVLYPRWYITKQPPGARVWVLNEKGFAAFLTNEPPKLSRDEVALFVDRLTLHLSPAT